MSNLSAALPMILSVEKEGFYPTFEMVPNVIE
jgi:hypothetical protein